jgi:hypothetical protein
MKKEVRVKVEIVTRGRKFALSMLAEDQEPLMDRHKPILIVRSRKALITAIS